MSNLNRCGPRKKPLKETPLTSYRRTLVYQWLETVRVTQDRTGGVISLMRDRRDMPRTFPTKGHMFRYMKKCGAGDDAIEHVFERVWSMYRAWLEQARSSTEVTSAAALVRPQKVSDNPWDDYKD